MGEGCELSHLQWSSPSSSTLSQGNVLFNPAAAACLLAFMTEVCSCSYSFSICLFKSTLGLPGWLSLASVPTYTNNSLKSVRTPICLQSGQFTLSPLAIHLASAKVSLSGKLNPDRLSSETHLCLKETKGRWETQPQAFPLFLYSVSQSRILNGHYGGRGGGQEAGHKWWESRKASSSCYLHSLNIPLFFQAKAWRVVNQSIHLPDWSLLFTPQFLHDGQQVAFRFTSPVSCPPSPTGHRFHGFTE